MSLTAPADDRIDRRPVALQGFGLLDDGTTFGLSVLDLTYDGCKVESAMPIPPGISLKVSVLGLGGVIKATVVWSKNGSAGLRFTRESTPHKPRRFRSHPRTSVCGEVLLRRKGSHGYRVRLFNLTPAGCKVEFVELPREGEVLWAKFEGLEAIESTVRWVDGSCGGLQFVRPVYPSIFDVILSRFEKAA